MLWDDIQKGARQVGCLVFAMDQGQTVVTTQPGPWGNAYSGYCNGLAVHWIALRYGGTDFRFDPKTLEVDMPDWRTTRNQNVYEDTPGDFPDRLAPEFAQYGMTLNKGRVTSRKETASGGILRRASAAAEGCYYISIRGSAGGHALAMQNTGGGGWRFFDSNKGEFIFTSNDLFESFIDGYMDATDYDTRLGDLVNIVGVNPPPYVAAGFGDSIKDLVKKYGG